MATSELPNYETPDLLVYGTFRELTKLDWALGIYPAPTMKKPKKKKKKPKWGGCQVSGFGASSSGSCGSSSS